MDKGKIILSPDYWISLSAPAGSGKTYWLSKRFMEIIKRENINPLRILAITFTEKAAGEMKMRILNMAKREYPEIYQKYEEEFMMLRVSTIHSFCNSFVRRFGNEIDVPLGFEILSESDANLYFEEKVNEFILEKIFRKKEEYEWILSASAFFKWTRFFDIFKNFYYKRPLTDRMFYNAKNLQEIVKQIPVEFEEIEEIVEKIKEIAGKEIFPDYKDLIEKPEETYKLIKIAGKLEKLIPDKSLKSKFLKALYDLLFFHITFIFSLFFKEILEYYIKTKSLEAKVDFSDMEFFAYQILNEGKIEEIDNVLEAFDERTSHILVDEFQDTNFLQWSIIEKLTEEWRSGWGAKFEKGEKTSIFLVGDPMQSIYMFRNANVKTFKKAKDEIKIWLGEKAKVETLKDNYRSLGGIIDFVNGIFLKDKNIEYVPFVKRRNNNDRGFVEIIIIEDTKDVEGEIRAVAKKIKNLIGKEIVYEKETEEKKKCEYRDIAVLLRKRANLSIYERVFKEEKIPYCIVGGIGFWNEPEIEFLTNFIEFLAEPSYTKGEYLLLKSPLFGLNEKEILEIRLQSDNLWDGLPESIKNEINNLRKEIEEKGITKALIDYLLNKALFKYLGSDIQKVKNVLKLLKILGYFEKGGKNIYEIAGELRRLRKVENEPRANVFSEGMNAVRILTIHRAKGLEFPVVFVPEVDSIKTEKKDVFAFDEDENGYFFKIYPSQKGKIKFSFYENYIQKLKEEEKRILYVALTRARDGLIISGKFSFKNSPSPENNAFQYLLYHAGITKEGKKYKLKEEFKDVKITRPEEIPDKEVEEKEEKIEKEMIDFERKIYLPEKKTYSSINEYYNIVFGDVMHAIFDRTSRGIIEEKRIIDFAEKLFLEKGICSEVKKEFIEEIKNQMEILKKKGIWEKIISPRKNSFSEFEFIYQEEGEIKKGRIDRLLLKGEIGEIYDYKISVHEQNEKIKNKIIEESIPQIEKYKEAVKNYFGVKEVKGFIIFTKEGKVVEV